MVFARFYFYLRLPTKIQGNPVSNAYSSHKMATVSIDKGALDIKLDLIDSFLAFHGSFHIPLAHVTNAYVSTLEDLQLEYRLEGTNLGFLRSAGVFSNPQGLIFVDAAHGYCLVLETRGERYPRIAVQPPDGVDANALAHAIMRAIPDSGPVD
jgi:hypothetical protein